MIIKLEVSHDNMANLHKFLHGPENSFPEQNLRLLKPKGDNFNGFFTTQTFAAILGTPKAEDRGSEGFVYHVTLELTEEFDVGVHTAHDDVTAERPHGWGSTGERYRVPHERYISLFRSVGIS